MKDEFYEKQSVEYLRGCIASAEERHRKAMATGQFDTNVSEILHCHFISKLTQMINRKLAAQEA